MVLGQNSCFTHMESHLIFLKGCYLEAELPVSAFFYPHNTVHTQIHSGHFRPGYQKVSIEMEAAAEKSRAG